MVAPAHPALASILGLGILTTERKSSLGTCAEAAEGCGPWEAEFAGRMLRYVRTHICGFRISEIRSRWSGLSK